jgi:hypothetical protein
VKKQLFSVFLIGFLPLFVFGQKKMVFFQENGIAFPSSVEKIFVEQTSNQVKKTVRSIQMQGIEKGYFLCGIELFRTSENCDSFLVQLGHRFNIIITVLVFIAFGSGLYLKLNFNHATKVP